METYPEHFDEFLARYAPDASPEERERYARAFLAGAIACAAINALQPPEVTVKDL